jgi:Helitron helicase-like domain at N-terminus
MDSCARSNHDADITGGNIRKRLILPATHIGNDRHMHKLFQDSMAIVRFFGNPDLFITFTANPNWPEITAGGQTGANHIDLVARVFHLKLQALLKDLKGGLFGKYKA